MSRLVELIDELCPDGVEYKSLWELTAWDKKFNGIDKSFQKRVISYPYLLAADLFAMQQDFGNVFLLSTGNKTGWTTEEIAKEYLCEGEVVAIPWGGTPNVKYHSGKFVTADNRIATSLDTNVLSNKFLYYWMSNNINLISSFYRGSGIKHPSMKDVLDMRIPLPPLPVQQEIVRILDNFTELTEELTEELTARKKQYAYYRNELLTFDDDIPKMNLKDVCELTSGGDVPEGHWAKEKTDGYKVPIFSNGVDNDGLYGYTDVPRITAPCVTIAGRGAGCGNAILRKKSFFPIIRLISAVPKEMLNVSFLYYCIQMIEFKIPQSGIPQLTVPMVSGYTIPVPPIDEQERIVAMLDRFDALCNDLTIGLPAEINARRKQYEYYRDKLLTFKEASA